MPANRLHLVPLTLAQANEHCAAWHRHNRPVPGAKFTVGAADSDGVLHAVAIAGRPVARAFDDGMTIEVVRVASDGHRNACSMLYGACQRAAFALGYRRVITYTQAGESGASPKAAGFHVIGERPPRAGWSAPSRPRDNETYRSSQRQLWEVVSPGSLTSPVDTAPRGYVEHGPDGPQAVYHAETPDAYLEHGDR